MEGDGIPGEGAVLFAVVEGAADGDIAVARGDSQAKAVEALPALDGTRLDVEEEEAGILLD